MHLSGYLKYKLKPLVYHHYKLDKNIKFTDEILNKFIKEKLLNLPYNNYYHKIILLIFMIIGGFIFKNVFYLLSENLLNFLLLKNHLY